MGVIPAAGFGERMLPLTGDTPKALLPILNKPLMSYTIERMQDIGVEDILVITGHLGEQIEREIRGVKFIRQRKIEGAAKAIKLVEKYVGEDFLLIWGDNFFQGDLSRLFSTHFERRADVSFILDERKIKKSAVAFIENGKITRIEERPKEGAGDATFAGVYILTRVIFDAIGRITKSETGEYEFADALQLIVDRGLRVSYVWLDGWRMNVTTPSDLLKANLRMIKERKMKYLVGEKCKIKGEVETSVIGNKVTVNYGSRITNSLIMDGVEVKENVKVQNAIIRKGRNVEKDCIGRSLEKLFIL